jgi:hypothetical protein
MRISKSQAQRAAKKLKIDVNIDKLQKGMNIEMKEHHKALGGSVTRAAMIASDHLKEHRNAYGK